MKASLGSDAGCMELSTVLLPEPTGRRVGPGWNNPPTSECEPEPLRSSLTQEEHLGFFRRGCHAEDLSQRLLHQPHTGHTFYNGTCSQDHLEVMPLT